MCIYNINLYWRLYIEYEILTYFLQYLFMYSMPLFITKKKQTFISVECIVLLNFICLGMCQISLLRIYSIFVRLKHLSYTTSKIFRARKIHSHIRFQTVYLWIKNIYFDAKSEQIWTQQKQFIRNYLILFRYCVWKVNIYFNIFRFL